MSELFLLYTLLTSIFLLSGTLIIVVKYLLNVLKRDNKHHKDIDRIIQGAQKKAEEIISSAGEKAHEIVRQTEILSRNAAVSLDDVAASLHAKQEDELRKASEVMLNDYKAALNSLHQDNINLFRNILKVIEEKISSEIADFGEILKKETIESQKIVGEKIEARFQEIQEELENYKANQLAKLRENLYEITRNAVEAAIGKSLDRELHEELLMDALREAVEKSQGGS